MEYTELLVVIVFSCVIGMVHLGSCRNITKTFVEEERKKKSRNTFRFYQEDCSVIVEANATSSKLANSFFLYRFFLFHFCFVKSYTASGV